MENEYTDIPTECCDCHAPLQELEEEHCFLKLVCAVCKNIWVIKSGKAARNGKL